MKNIPGFNYSCMWSALYAEQSTRFVVSVAAIRTRSASMKKRALISFDRCDYSFKESISKSNIKQRTHLKVIAARFAAALPIYLNSVP